jgi:hypothetical protein
MMTKNLLCCAVFVAAPIALGGCERRETRTTTTESPPVAAPPTVRRDLPPMSDELGIGGGPVAIHDAIERIVGARCEREMRCGNVGADKKFSDDSNCRSEVMKDFHDDLNAEECPAGVDAKELNECLTEARNEDCGNPFDTIGRVVACRTSDICRNVR